MKKYILSLVVAAFGLTLFGAKPVMAVVNSVTPSTNDINRTNGWAHVDQLSQGVGTTDLKFISTRAFASCFEYRTDGDTSQKTSNTNYNTLITDGLYPYHCKNNSNSTYTITANAYVEVRMVFGAEGDERFDWTRFNVEQDPCLDTNSENDGGCPTPTATPIPQQPQGNGFGLPGDGRSDGQSDGRSSCPDCTKAPQVLGATTEGQVLGATTDFAATGTAVDMLVNAIGAVGGLSTAVGLALIGKKKS